ncbi:MAG: site-2 protease family protein [Clostridia bacterium]|nr:site-2 protease family protein [Clostridia bacterium]
MEIKVDLKIFLFIILFYFTKQIEIYTIMLIFALIHEFGHLIMGILVGMKPKKIEIMPYGFSIRFKVEPSNYNKRILNGNILEVKKILVAMAGPLTNLIIILISNYIHQEKIIIYANTLIMLFNLMPIYPLDGGRIVKGIMYIIFGKEKSILYTRNISLVVLAIVTTTASIGILYLKNIAIFIITIFLWMLYIKQEIIEKKRSKLLNLVKNNSKLELRKNKENSNEKR